MINTSAPNKQLTQLSPHTLLPLVCLMSGGSALIYETLWIRAFANILGSTAHAASAVFAAFLTGLALGAWLFGAYADRIRRLVPGYMILEAGIALCASSIGLLIHNYSDMLAIILGDATSHAIIAFPMALILILLPTLLMGATLPLVLVLSRRYGGGRKEICRLYAFNTLGAAAGTLICGFFTIRLFGVTNSYLIGATLNLTAAFLCMLLPREHHVEPTMEQNEETQAITTNQEVKSTPEWLLAVIAMGSGLSVLGVEIIWIRLGSFFLGNRTYAFTTLLFSVLILLAAGSALASRFYRRYGKRPLMLLGWLLTAATVSIPLSTAAAAWWVRNQDRLETSLPLFASLSVPYRFAETFILLSMILIPLGTLFPLALSISRDSANRIGRTTGRYYLINTIGAVIGSCGVGFVAFPTVGVFGATALICLFTGGLAIMTFTFSSGGKRLSGFAVAGIALIGVLPGNISLVGPHEVSLFQIEDEYGIFEVIGLPDNTKKVVNNKTELIFRVGMFSTSYVQQMQGHLGVFFYPRARTALVLGSGYGITAGALGVHPTLERVDAVEIIPGMVQAADLFEPFNLSYHKNPRVHVFIDDGRHFLARRPHKYDIISVNVSDPHLPGGSSFFHTEFYDLVKQRLSDDGVMIQHAFGSDINTVLATLAASFRYLRLFPAYANGFNVVAADRPLELDLNAVSRLSSQPPVRNALSDLGIFEPVRPAQLFQNAFRPEDLPSRFRGGKISTDDHPHIEFSWRQSGVGILFSNE